MDDDKLLLLCKVLIIHIETAKSFSMLLLDNPVKYLLDSYDISEAHFNSYLSSLYPNVEHQFYLFRRVECYKELVRDLKLKKLINV